MNRLLTGVNAAAVVALLWGSATPVYAGCCEEGTKELLAEHITDYSPIPGATNLPGCEDTTDSLFEEFGDAGGWLRQPFADALAWESDWKQTSLPGGADASFADAKDFSYFCGHGNVGFVKFTTNNTDTVLVPTDTNFGDVDVEWVTFDTSKTLNSAVVDAWHNNAFKGRLHLLIGWHDSPLDGDTGGEFADDLIASGWPDGGGEPIVGSWFASDGGCTDQDSGTTQMIIAEDVNNSSDHLHGQGSVTADPVFDNVAFFFVHDC
jgi:hypothetical protein